MQLLIKQRVFSWTDSYDIYDENGNEVFFYLDSSDDNYYIQNATQYDLYLNGRYVYTDDIIIDDFKELPVYEGEEK